jgi:diguanylate cyclase (GGDEF)-like protein
MGAAVTAVKVMYVGSCFVTPLFLLFVMDYCRVNLGAGVMRAVTGAVLAVPTAILLLVWTFDRHNLIYQTYFFDAGAPLSGLQVVPGALYSLSNIYATLCIAATCAILVSRLFQWQKSQRKTLVLMMVSAIVPTVANLLYFASVYLFRVTPTLNYTPYVLVTVNLIFYVSIMRYNLFDFVPIAYNVAFDSINDAVVVVDAEMGYIESNASAKKIFPGMELFRGGVPVTMLESWPPPLADLRAAEGQEGIHFSPEGDGGSVFSASVNAITDAYENPLGWIVLVQNITTTEQLMRQLETAAYMDALTGLYNRRYFLEIAEMEFEKSKRMNLPCYAMIFDLDYFKKVNDTHGHLAGDAVLCAVAARVKDTMRSYDLLARYGGEEFVVLLEVASDTDEDIAVTLAERIRAVAARTPCVYENIEIPITLSIGVASNLGVPSLEELLKHADRAMYSAKEDGRNRVVMYNEEEWSERR